MNIIGKTHPIVAIPPTVNTGALVGDYVSMKGASHCSIIVNIAQGNAAVCALTLHQATLVDGTGEKAIAQNVQISSNLDVAASDVLVARAEGVGYTTDAGVKNKLIVFEVPAEKLDVNGGFDCLCLKAAASNAANIISAEYIMSGERYHGSSKITN